MTEKEMVLKTFGEFPDDCSIDEIADRIEFLAAVQKGFDQLDRGEGIPPRRDQETVGLMDCELIRSSTRSGSLSLARRFNAGKDQRRGRVA